MQSDSNIYRQTCDTGSSTVPRGRTLLSWHVRKIYVEPRRRFANGSKLRHNEIDLRPRENTVCDCGTSACTSNQSAQVKKRRKTKRSVEGESEGRSAKGSFKKGRPCRRHRDSNQARPLLNERSLGNEIVCELARLCVPRVYCTNVHTDEYLLGTKGSQLPSYVRCHAHHRLYNPSCDVRLFNPFITESALSLSHSHASTHTHMYLRFFSSLRTVVCIAHGRIAKGETEMKTTKRGSAVLRPRGERSNGNSSFRRGRR